MAKCVEVTLKDDGSLTVVECEPEMEGEGAGQSFDNIKDALMAAAEMLTSEQTEDPMKAQASAEQDMATGFGSVRGRGLNG